MLLQATKQTEFLFLRNSRIQFGAQYLCTYCTCYSYGQHLTTHDVMTGAMTYKFTYNVKSYYAHLVRVTDVLAGKSVVVRRDYRLHAQYLTTMTTKGARGHLSQSHRSQRCHVTTDSNGLLASLRTPSSVVRRLSYVRDTGLLSSSQTQSGAGSDGVDGHVYKYGQDGRVTSVISATGDECVFTRRVYGDTIYLNSSCDGSRVQLTQHNHSLDVHCSKTHSLLRCISAVTFRSFCNCHCHEIQRRTMQ